MCQNIVKELIGKGKVKEAIEKMIESVAESDASAVLLLQMRLNSLNQKEMLGLISQAEALTEKNSITYSVLTLCDEIQKRGGNPTPSPSPNPQPLVPSRIFVSFKDSDIGHLTNLENQFKPVLRGKPVTIWHKGKMPFNEDRLQVIETELGKADIIILLVSSEYLADDEIWQHEFMPAFARLQKKECALIPVILSACAWQNTEIGGLKVLPELNRNIMQMNDSAAAWLTVVNAVMEVLKSRR